MKLCQASHRLRQEYQRPLEVQSNLNETRPDTRPSDASSIGDFSLMLTDGPTDGPMDGPTDGPTDGQTLI